MTNSEHCRRNPLHLNSSPLNLSGNTSRGLTEGGELVAMSTGVLIRAAAGGVDDRLRPYNVFTNSSVNVVKQAMMLVNSQLVGLCR